MQTAQAIVVLGESHTDADHHRWQLQTLAGLYGHNGRMAIGFEAFQNPDGFCSVLGPRDIRLVQKTSSKRGFAGAKNPWCFLGLECT